MQWSQMELAVKCQEIHMVSNLLLLIRNIVIGALQKSERANGQSSRSIPHIPSKPHRERHDIVSHIHSGTRSYTM